jgi:predicted phosphodiesterase
MDRQSSRESVLGRFRELQRGIMTPSTAGRVAVLSDVHGNHPALLAVLAALETELAAPDPVDTVVFLGDLTWGPEPRAVLDTAAALPVPTYFVRGNADRAVSELADGTRTDVTGQALDGWMLDAHGEAGVRQVSGFAPSVTLATPLGATWFCHGSPRSDIELLTPATNAERLTAATAGIAERIIVHGHTHLQYQRVVGDLTVIAPGSVGIPYTTGGVPGARWAIIGESITLRTTPYDVEEAVHAAERVGYPSVGYARYLRTPPTLEEIVADAEHREFAD